MTDLERWQRDQIEAGIREADAGEFATPEEMEETFARWRRRRK